MSAPDLKETGENLLSTEEKLERKVSIWWVRHGSPAPDYSEEFPLKHAAWDELRETAKTIFETAQPGETVVFFGAGPRSRHRQSQFLLEHFLFDLIRESGKGIKLIVPDIKDKKQRTARMRPSLREVEFGEEFREKAQKLGFGDAIEYWLEEDESLKEESESSEEAKIRTKRLIKGLLKYTARQGKGPKVHWVCVSSRWAITPLASEAFGKELEPGLPGGKWYRFDAEPGKIEEVQMVHWIGGGCEVKLKPE